MEKVRLGLIGLGYIGKVHLRDRLKLKQAKLIAVLHLSDKALNLAKKCASRKPVLTINNL
jgi:predicted dehydrogenase